MKTTTVFACTLGLMLGIAMTGCKKENPAPATPASPGTPTTQAAATGGQTLCPVGGGKIDPKVFTEYKGKKVYFCCDGCIEPFKKDPEKYVKKLPQFGGKDEPAAGGMNMGS
jgi:YHS domain-containing protein